MSVHLEDGQFLPEYPMFSDEDLENAQQTGDAMPLLFEWYKWTGFVANRMACLRGTPDSLRKLPKVEDAVLRGLLNRASRLMLAILRLAQLHKHAEAVRLMNRSVCETAVLLQWLCKSGSGEPFRRYLAKGLEAELRLKQHIEENIRARGGAVQPVEARMLHAVAELCASAELTEAEVRATKPLPDLASMLRTLGHEELSYTVLQRLGSHAVHGTWPDLMFHYLEIKDGEFVPSDNVIRADGTEFVASATVLLEAVAAYSRFVLLDQEMAGEST